MAERDLDAERLERLIASNEATANAINRLVQVLERQQRKRDTKVQRVRPNVRRTAKITPKAQAAADAALARLGLKG